MPTLLIQRGKGGRDYQEVGPEYPLAVEINQGDGALAVPVSSPVYRTDLRTIPGIGTASAYASGDAFGGKFTITVPLSGTITNLVFLDYDDEGLIKEFVLFARDFTATADNAAFAVSDEDLGSCTGIVSVDTFYNFANNQIGHATPALSYVTLDGLLYCQVVTRGADNIAAGAIPAFFLVVV